MKSVAAQAEGPERRRPAARATARGKATGFDRGAFYRFCRMAHAYLSAFAFIALMFFSATGLLINHPDWLKGPARESQSRVILPSGELAAALRASDSNAALAAAVARELPLLGAYRGGEAEGGEVSLRFEGVKGASTVFVNLEDGRAEATVETPSALTVIGDLHRGKNAAPAWRLVIDVAAVLVLALSAIGYVLFFSLRFRLRTSLALTGASLAVLGAVFLWLTP